MTRNLTGVRPSMLHAAVLAAACSTVARASQEAVRRSPTRPALGTLLDVRSAPRPGFLEAIDVDGDRCIVGIHNDDVAPDCGVCLSAYEPPSDPGRASIYSKSDDGWRLESDLVPLDSAHRVGFGHAVALEGRTAVVGTRRSLGMSGFDGEVHLFEEVEPGRWQQVLHLRPDAPDEFFGASIAMGVGVVAIGAPAVGRSQKPGRVHVLERISGSWTHTSTLHPPVVARDASALRGWDFGAAVAVRGSTIAVGFQYDWNSEGTSGSVFLYERDETGAWCVRQRLIVPFQPWRPFGEQLFFTSDDEIIVTVDSSSSDAWRAWPFRKEASGWVRGDCLGWPGTSGARSIGLVLAGNGDRLVLGAPRGGDVHGDSGVVFEFERSDGKWAPASTWSTPPTLDCEAFGCAVAIARDSLLVGLRREHGGPAVFEIADR